MHQSCKLSRPISTYDYRWWILTGASTLQSMIALAFGISKSPISHFWSNPTTNSINYSSVGRRTTSLWRKFCNRPTAHKCSIKSSKFLSIPKYLCYACWEKPSELDARAPSRIFSSAQHKTSIRCHSRNILIYQNFIKKGHSSLI